MKLGRRGTISHGPMPKLPGKHFSQSPVVFRNIRPSVIRLLSVISIPSLRPSRPILDKRRLNVRFMNIAARMDHFAQIIGLSGQGLGVFAPLANISHNLLMRSARIPALRHAGRSRSSLRGRRGASLRWRRARRRIVRDIRSRSSAMNFACCHVFT